MKSLEAPCGFDCARCPACLATASGDPAELRKVWELWDPATRPGTPEGVRCAGCLSEGPRLEFCEACELRRARGTDLGRDEASRRDGDRVEMARKERVREREPRRGALSRTGIT